MEILILVKKLEKDIFGRIYLDAYKGKTTNYRLTSDGFELDKRSISVYIQGFKEWAKIEKRILSNLKGKILDLGAGTGRHSIYLQRKGCDIYALDLSPLAIKIMKNRGIKNTCELDWMEIDKKFKKEFDYVLMMFNNFGMVGNEKGIKKILKKVEKITKKNGKFIISTVDPEKLGGGEFSKFPLIIEYKNMVSEISEMILMSPKYLEILLEKTNWEIQEYDYCERDFHAAYLAVLKKRK